jgi:hypothetical protein
MTLTGGNVGQARLGNADSAEEEEHRASSQERNDHPYPSGGALDHRLSFPSSIRMVYTLA